MIQSKKSVSGPLAIPAAEPSDAPVKISAKTGELVLRILSKPGARESSVVAVDDEAVHVAIGAPPKVAAFEMLSRLTMAQDGEANAELVAFLSGVLGVRKSDIAIDRGSRSRFKTVRRFIAQVIHHARR